MQNKVTNIQIIPVRPKDGLVAFASFIFDNSFYFSSIGIYTRPQGGYRLTYPTRKKPRSSISLFHPINKKIASMIEAAVIHKYEKITADRSLILFHGNQPPQLELSLRMHLNWRNWSITILTHFTIP